MTENTLYLVVVDGRTESRPDPYLSYINTFAPQSPVILVINKVDENQRADLNRQSYLKAYKNLHPKMIRFSCVDKPEKCVEELLEEIEAVLFGDDYGPLLQILLPPRWRMVRNELIELLQERKTYIEADEYYAICKKNELPEKKWETIRDICNTLGLIFSYRNENSSPAIDRILHPEWVTEGINCICTLPEGNYHLVRTINRFMRKNNYRDHETHSILAMLQEKDLATQLQDFENKPYFIPALLPGKPPSVFPKDYEDWYAVPNTISSEIRFRYPFLHPIVKQKFMIKLCQNSQDMYAYRYGTYWLGDGEHVRVVMMEENNDLAFYLLGQTAMVIHHEQDFIRRTMKTIHRDLMKTIHREGEIKSTLIHVFHAVCVDENGTQVKLSAEYSDDDLWTLIQMGVKELPLPGTRQIILVEDFLAGFTKQTNEEGSKVIMSKTITITNSPGVVIAGENITGSTISTTVGLSPEKKRFSEEIDQAIDVVKNLQDLDQNQKNALIGLLNDANDATQKEDDEKKKSCKEKFNGFLLFAGKTVDVLLKAFGGFTTVASFFGVNPV